MDIKINDEIIKINNISLITIINAFKDLNIMLTSVQNKNIEKIIIINNSLNNKININNSDDTQFIAVQENANIIVIFYIENKIIIKSYDNKIKNTIIDSFDNFGNSKRSLFVDTQENINCTELLSSAFLYIINKNTNKSIKLINKQTFSLDNKFNIILSENTEWKQIDIMNEINLLNQIKNDSNNSYNIYNYAFTQTKYISNRMIDNLINKNDKQIENILIKQININNEKLFKFIEEKINKIVIGNVPNQINNIQSANSINNLLESSIENPVENPVENPINNLTENSVENPISNQNEKTEEEDINNILSYTKNSDEIQSNRSLSRNRITPTDRRKYGITSPIQITKLSRNTTPINDNQYALRVTPPLTRHSSMAIEQSGLPSLVLQQDDIGFNYTKIKNDEIKHNLTIFGSEGNIINLISFKFFDNKYDIKNININGISNDKYSLTTTKSSGEIIYSLSFGTGVQIPCDLVIDFTTNELSQNYFITITTVINDTKIGFTKRIML